MKKRSSSRIPVTPTTKNSPASHPIVDFRDLVAHRSDRSGFAGLCVTLYDLPDCGAVSAEAGSDGYWFAYRPRAEKGDTRLTMPRLGLANRRVTRDNFLLVPPHVPLRGQWTNAGGRVAYFLFSPRCIESIARKVGLPAPVLQQVSHSTFSVDQRLEALCRLLMEETESDCRLGPIYFESVARALVVGMLSQVRADNATRRLASAVHPGIRRVIQSLEDHWSDDVSVAELADQAHLSLDHFARAFAKVTGLAPHRYLLQVRLSRARELMTQKDQTMSLAEIAAACGFYDQGHLTRHFRRAFGETPSAFWRERKYPKL